MKWIVTGAAGFIGTNTAARLLARGDQVVGIDNLSRPGTRLNLEWLRREHDELEFIEADVREADEIQRIFAAHADASTVLHLAGQVAVTTSVRDPRADFEANALGTFNVAEAVRLATPSALLVFASTNKVYGSDLGPLELTNEGWDAVDHPHGIPESQPLDLHSPYACSKGAGDQYVIDYARVFGLATVSVRQSCIYGPRQFGIEDQGWVAWLTLASLSGRAFTVYGDGSQVRDILYVDDLVDFYIACATDPDAARGHAFNIGGGPTRLLSVLGLVDRLEKRLGARPQHDFGPTRPGDQRYYVSDIRSSEHVLGWSPSTSVDDGLEKMIEWLSDNLDTVNEVLDAARLRADVEAPEAR